MILFKLLKRVWLPLILVLVVGVGALTVMRIRSVFGGESAADISIKVDETKPSNPKFVTYEVTGQTGATADINYMDLQSKPQRLDGVALPWSITLQTTEAGVAPNLLAQSTGTEIECRITVDDKVKAQRAATGVKAMTFCLVKSA